MKITRKDFLRLSGLAVLTAGAVRTFEAARAAGETARRAIGGTSANSGTQKKQYAMAIDMRKCREHPGCEICMKACRAAHNVPLIPDPRHEVKWIWNAPFAEVFPVAQSAYTRRNYTASPLPVLCNHCDQPPCVEVCPTGATWKRQEDGIVMMDWHRCIGCKYCMVACPYEARSFNFVDPRAYLEHVNPDFPTRSMGVVEKCDFCAERLAVGQPPACAEACPAGAIAFGDLADPNSPVSQALAASFSLRRKPELGTGPNIYYLV
jgi:molybdopterin-containing oxidoreductase family iron-sulfur binding subunit